MMIMRFLCAVPLCIHPLRLLRSYPHTHIHIHSSQASRQPPYLAAALRLSPFFAHPTSTSHPSPSSTHPTHAAPPVTMSTPNPGAWLAALQQQFLEGRNCDAIVRASIEQPLAKRARADDGVSFLRKLRTTRSRSKAAPIFLAMSTS